jgi:hypothetical protein
MMEPWHKVVTPRKEVREGRSFDPSEFAIALERVVARTAPLDYRDPVQFFSRTCFTRALRVWTSGIVRRRAGRGRPGRDGGIGWRRCSTRRGPCWRRRGQGARKEGLETYANEDRDARDREIVCPCCGARFTWTVGEQGFYALHGFQPPRRCPACRPSRRTGAAEPVTGR